MSRLAFSGRPYRAAILQFEAAPALPHHLIPRFPETEEAWRIQRSTKETRSTKAEASRTAFWLAKLAPKFRIALEQLSLHQIQIIQNNDPPPSSNE